MGKVKEMRLSVQTLLILMLSNMGMDTPENIEEITDFVFEDVQETADPLEWHSGDVAIAFRRWIEAQAMSDTGTGKSKPVINPEATEKVIKIINSGLYGTVPDEIKGMSDVEAQKYCNEKFDPSAKEIVEGMTKTHNDRYGRPNGKPTDVIGLGDQISTVGELRKLMSDLDTNDVVCVEGIDLQTGDVQDLYPMNLDVIEDIKLSDGSVVREVRFCQMMNSAPDTRNKQPIIDALIETFEPMTDTTVLEELLKTIPFEILLHSLPEVDWVKYRYETIKPDNVLIPLSDENIWSQIGSDHEDDDKIFIDAWLSGDDNEVGKVIAKIDIHTKEVIYFDQRARDDKYAQEVIQERLSKL